MVVTLVRQQSIGTWSSHLSSGITIFLVRYWSGDWVRSIIVVVGWGANKRDVIGTMVLTSHYQTILMLLTISSGGNLYTPGKLGKIAARIHCRSGASGAPH